MLLIIINKRKYKQKQDYKINNKSHLKDIHFLTVAGSGLLTLTQTKFRLL
jgi:hypothetical protein